MESPDSNLWALPWAIFLIGASIYTFMPIVMWLQFRHRIHATHEMLPPEELPPDIRAEFHRYAPDLAQQGFIVLGYVHIAAAAPNAKVYMACWIHEQRGQMASVTAVVPAMGMTQFTLDYTTAISPDARTVETVNNASQAGIFETVPRRNRAYFEFVRNANGLYQVHLNREAKQIDPTATRYLPSSSDLIRAIQNESYHTLREQMRAGILREAKAAGEFRLTVIGALKCAYRQLPPLKQMRSLRAARLARHEYAAAMANPAPPPAEPVKLTHVSPYDSAPAGDLLNYG